jgi:histone H2A
MATPKSQGKKSGAKKGSSKGSVSKKVGLVFPVGRVGSLLRKGKYSKRVGGAAPAYLTAVLEYLAAELLDLAGKNAKQNKKTRLTPRAITLAVRHDEDLSNLLGNVTLSKGGVVPNVHAVLEKKKKGSKSEGKKAKKEGKSKGKK